jgi:hypothetical protein
MFRGVAFGRLAAAASGGSRQIPGRQVVRVLPMLRPSTIVRPMTSQRVTIA